MLTCITDLGSRASTYEDSEADKGGGRTLDKLGLKTRKRNKRSRHDKEELTNSHGINHYCSEVAPPTANHSLLMFIGQGSRRSVPDPIASCAG